MWTRTPSSLTRCVRAHPGLCSVQSTLGWSHRACNADCIHTIFSGTFQMSLTETTAGACLVDLGPMRGRKKKKGWRMSTRQVARKIGRCLTVDNNTSLELKSRRTCSHEVLRHCIHVTCAFGSLRYPARECCEMSRHTGNQPFVFLRLTSFVFEVPLGTRRPMKVLEILTKYFARELFLGAPRCVHVPVDARSSQVFSSWE